MDVLMLCYRDEPLREFAIRGATLEVGCAPGCDIVVHDPDVAERHLLVQARGGTVYVHEARGGQREWRHLPPNEPVSLGRWHSLVRVPDAPTRPHLLVGNTEPLAVSDEASLGLSLILGRGPDARRVALDGRPLSIGTASDNDLMLRDRAVSAHHCRLEPGAGGWRVRDLASRNGTYVDGVPVVLGCVGASSTIRVGRTDLRLVARERRPSNAEIVAESPAMRDVVAKVERFAKNRMPVLVTGESGTGKEGIARALHLAGPRAGQPFVAVNAGGMAASLVESELFGHERGAFTGANAVHRGVFEQAHGGTLFLDEIGELPLDLQARLLRVLETQEVRRVGAESVIQVDVRLVCATHRDLQRMVAEGSMRRDLFFRLAVLMIEIPPLRDRPRDVEALASHFLARAVEQLGPRKLSAPAVSRLLSYSWPGNARELRNVVLRAAASSAGACISAEDIDEAFGDGGCSTAGVIDASSAQLEQVIGLHNGNLTAAARALGLPRETLRDRLKTARRKAG